MKPWLVASIALLTVAAAQPAAAAFLVYQSDLTGAAEAPPNLSPGSGFATVTYDDVLQTLRVQIDFQDLLGTTTAAHIHVRPTEVDPTGAIVSPTPTFPGFPLGVTAGSYDQTFDMTLAGSYNPSLLASPLILGDTALALDHVLSGLADGRAYVNVHTNEFPGGEIRGDLAAPSTAVPEPATWSLLIAGFGLAGAGLRRRYRFGRYATSTLPAC